MNIFSTSMGTVAILVAPGSSPFTITIPGFPTSYGAIQKASIRVGGNYQILNTLQNTIYAYVFGEKVGDMVIAGVAFSAVCNGGGSGSDIFGFYLNNAISVTGLPMFITLGMAGFNAFLTELETGFEDPVTQVGMFNMSLKMVP